eukprot:867204-Pelagomonas_calceolata.AAC.2
MDEADPMQPSSAASRLMGLVAGVYFRPCRRPQSALPATFDDLGIYECNMPLHSLLPSSGRPGQILGLTEVLHPCPRDAPRILGPSLPLPIASTRT